MTPIDLGPPLERGVGEDAHEADAAAADRRGPTAAGDLAPDRPRGLGVVGAGPRLDPQKTQRRRIGGAIIDSGAQPGPTAHGRGGFDRTRPRLLR